MRARLIPIVVLVILAPLANACRGEASRSPAATLAGSTACAAPAASAPPGCWKEIRPLGSGGFPPAPGSNDRPLWEPGKFPLTLRPLVAFNGDLWMSGQTVAYSSPDGLTWAQHAKTDSGSRIYASTVFFKGKLWMYGGLEYNERRFLNDIWSSADGKSWERAGTAAWPARGAQAMVVFRGRLWLFGGANHIAADRSTDGFLNDVWVSDDGLAWTQVTAAAAWSAREYPAIVAFKNDLYMLGAEGQADVWRSANGTDWVPLASEAPWKPRHGFAHLSFDGKLWVFGGFVGMSTNALNDVWYSSDGATWERQAEHAPWAPRLPVAIAFRDRIWIYSGKHTGGADNWGGDLWQMAAKSE